MIYLTGATRDASLVEIRQNFDGSGQDFKSWHERSEANPEQRKGEENIMETNISTVSYSLSEGEIITEGDVPKWVYLVKIKK